MFYTKAARLAPSKRLSSLYLSYILAANYLGTALVPFFFGWLKSLLHLQGNAFPFLFGALLMAVILVLALVMPRRYAFRAVK
jgi:MFS family permease